MLKYVTIFINYNKIIKKEYRAYQLDKHGCTYFLELLIACTTIHETIAAIKALITQYTGFRNKVFISSSVLNINVGNLIS